MAGSLRDVTCDDIHYSVIFLCLQLDLVNQQGKRSNQEVTRPLSFTRTLRLKEDKPQDGHELEKAKQQQHHSEEKRDELRSSSESAVKADENKQDVESLQKETAKQSQKEHAHGKS
ncbi:hypothetical protein AC578_433 [Pseudocercospora eumusae]|uniref:Uncharacterized protein n=1 Tax=Pseudocercospora eumusae TaxID=321146 RepID=A0A139HYG1_9PEZI|nr:hypothetical protein AC578_433 [Pseudocercospora eumusae]